MSYDENMSDDDTDDKGKDSDIVTLDQYSDILLELKDQPEWRSMADTASDYYDNMQLTDEQVKAADSLGLAPISKNYIRVIVNSLLGLEAKNRVNWRVVADSDQWQDVAEAESQWLNEVERETGVDRVKADVYKAMMVSGVGWAGVGRNQDPTQYPYRCDFVHRREIHWDWVGRREDMSDWRYLRRRRFFDADDVKIAFPNISASLIDNMVNGETYEPYLHESDDVSMTSASTADKVRQAMSDYEWRDVYNRVAVAELYTKKMVEDYVLPLPGGRAVAFNPDDSRHQMLIQQGAEPFMAWHKRTYRSFWLGPMKLGDGISYEGIPYVPAFGYREDLTGVPYGIVRDMIPLQDLINVLTSKAIWFLSSNRILFDTDALDLEVNNITDVLDNINRGDLAIALNPNRQNPQGLTILNNYGEAAKLFDVIGSTAQDMQMVVGIFNAMLGRESASTSGIAINALVEQGMTVMARLNDNFMQFNRMLGDKMLDMIIADRIGQPVEVVTGSGKGKRTVFVNYPAQALSQELMQMQQMQPSQKLQERAADIQKALEGASSPIVNDISSAVVATSLQDVPTTPAYRAQQLQQFQAMVASTSPQMQGVLVPYAIELTDIPDREEMAELARKVSGISPGDDQAQAQAAQQQAQAMMLQAAQASTKAAEQAARAEKALAEAQKIRQEIEILAMQTGVRPQQIQQQESVQSALPEEQPQPPVDQPPIMEDAALDDEDIVAGHPLHIEQQTEV